MWNEAMWTSEPRAFSCSRPAEAEYCSALKLYCCRCPKCCVHIIPVVVISCFFVNRAYILHTAVMCYQEGKKCCMGLNRVLDRCIYDCGNFVGIIAYTSTYSTIAHLCTAHQDTYVRVLCATYCCVLVVAVRLHCCIYSFEWSVHYHSNCVKLLLYLCVTLYLYYTRTTTAVHPICILLLVL